MSLKKHLCSAHYNVSVYLILCWLLAGVEIETHSDGRSLGNPLLLHESNLTNLDYICIWIGLGCSWAYIPNVHLMRKFRKAAKGIVGSGNPTLG